LAVEFLYTSTLFYIQGLVDVVRSFSSVSIFYSGADRSSRLCKFIQYARLLDSRAREVYSTEDIQLVHGKISIYTFWQNFDEGKVSTRRILRVRLYL
jgi:hypothetical protein